MQQTEKKVATAWSCLLDTAGVSQIKSEHDIPPAYEAFYLQHVFSSEECEELISTSEDEALGFGYGDTNYPKKYRGNLRLITTDRSLSGAVWNRIKDFIPSTVQLRGLTWEATGLNECWRLAKYFPGDRFQAHCDACFCRNEEEQSMFTVNI